MPRLRTSAVSTLSFLGRRNIPCRTFYHLWRPCCCSADSPGQPPRKTLTSKGRGATTAPAKAPQQSADKKANGPSRENQETSKEPAKSDVNRDTQRPSDANRDRSRSEDRAGARDVEKDRSSTDRRSESRTPPEADRQDRSRENDRAPRDAARETDRSDRTSRESDRPSRDSTDQRRGRQDRDATANFGITFSDRTSDDGLVISRLSSRGIFARAKFREGDIVVSIDGRRVRSQDDFFHWFHGDTRQRVPVVVLRDDREVTLYVEPEVTYDEPCAVARGGAWLGVDLVDRFRNQAMVLKVHPNSPAQRAGIRADDVIVAVEGEEITSPDHLGQVIGRLRPGDEVEIEVDRDRRARVLDAVLGQRNGVVQPADAGPELIPPQPEVRDLPPPPPREGRQPQRQERRGLLPFFQRG